MLFIFSKSTAFQAYATKGFLHNIVRNIIFGSVFLRHLQQEYVPYNHTCEGKKYVKNELTLRIFHVILNKILTIPTQNINIIVITQKIIIA